MLFNIQQLYPNIEKNLLDPFTGSGTFVNEAVNFYSTQKLNPQLLAFPFEHFVLESKSIEKKLFHRYLVSDMTDFALDNIKTISSDNVELKQKNYFEIESIPENTVIIINPPYNKRIQIDNPSEFYKKIIFKAQSLKAKALTMIYPSEFHSNLFADKIIYQQEIVNGGLKCSILVWEF
jgi:putative N6-adenine-specific DNA methylase